VGSNPTLSATFRVPAILLLRFALQPIQAWRSVRAADPSWRRTLFGVALPLSVLPAVAWPLGKGLPLLPSMVETVALSVATVLLLALGFYALAGFFEAKRHWSRAVALATYASVPVFLTGALLVVPVLVVASVGGFLYTLGMLYVGAQAMLDCRERDAAAYVASGCMFTGMTSMLLGGLCSAAGLI
jgi:hypothetical protein